MLWDIIRDFIVEHLTGGYNSAGEQINVTIGNAIMYSEGEIDDQYLASFNDLRYLVGDEAGYHAYISGSDWLATTITAVIMVLLVVFAVWLVRWIFKAVSSAFLLK